jgi:UDP-3-O-[3-hydroxymyristoyl] glucosamine N-acyltransferase
MSEPIFFAAVSHTIGEIAAQTGARMRDQKSADARIASAAPIESATGGAITFIDNPRYARHAAETGASAIICAPKYADRVPESIHLLIHDDPYRAYAVALSMLYPGSQRPVPVTGEDGISSQAIVGANVVLEDGVIVEPFAVVGEDAAIGAGSHIHTGAVIGRGVQIGRNTSVCTGASVSAAMIGNNVILHPGVRIGQDGFGFAMGPGGHRKVGQIGRVIIQDNVEIGANSTVDRGSNRDTVIGEGTKIDNLVQIGHNVIIGRHCVIVGLAGVAGSAKLGDYVVVAGQVGIVGHIEIGDGAQIGGGAGVNFNVKPGSKLMGYPATDVRTWTKMNMILKSMARKDMKGKGEE